MYVTVKDVMSAFEYGEKEAFGNPGISYGSGLATILYDTDRRSVILAWEHLQLGLQCMCAGTEVLGPAELPLYDYLHSRAEWTGKTVGGLWGSLLRGGAP